MMIEKERDEMRGEERREERDERGERREKAICIQLAGTH